MVDDRKPITYKKRKTRAWYDFMKVRHEKTTDHVVGVRKRDKQHKR